MYPRLLDETVDTEDLASVDVADETERDETVETVRPGEGQEIAGVGMIDGEGEEARTGGAPDSDSIDSSMIAWIKCADSTGG
jgi:hypothetical protein